MTKIIGTNQPDSYKGIKILEQVCRKLHLTRLKDNANSCYPQSTVDATQIKEHAQEHTKMSHYT